MYRVSQILQNQVSPHAMDTQSTILFFFFILFILFFFSIREVMSMLFSSQERLLPLPVLFSWGDTSSLLLLNSIE